MMRQPRTTFLWISVVVVAATVVSEVENKPYPHNNMYNNQSGMPYNPALQQIGPNGMPIGVGGVAPMGVGGMAPMGVNGIPAVGATGLMAAGHYPTMHQGGQSMYSNMPMQTNPAIMGQHQMVGAQMPMPNMVAPGFTPGLAQGVNPNMMQGNASLAYGQNLPQAYPNTSAFPAAQYGPTAPPYNGMPRY